MIKNFGNLIKSLEEVDKEEWIVGMSGLGDESVLITYTISNTKGDVIFETEVYDGEEYLSKVMEYIAEVNPRKVHLLIGLIGIYQDILSIALSFIDERVSREISDKIMGEVNRRLDILWQSVEVKDGE